MAEYLIQDTTLDAIANAINAKTGGSSAMTPAEMVTAIGSISGGGGLDDYFTPVNCVTIRNNSEYGYSNGFVIYGVPLNSVKKIEIRFKCAEANPTHFIWLTALASNNFSSYAAANPFIDKTTATGFTFNVDINETIDGVQHIVAQFSSNNTSNIRIGSWSDSTYSKTATYYELKMWDADDNPIVDLMPCINIATQKALFLNKATGICVSVTTPGVSSFIAGEVLS